MLQVLQELEELGAKVKFDGLKELKIQLAAEREKKQRLLERKLLKQQQREARLKEKEEKRALREAELLKMLVLSCTKTIRILSSFQFSSTLSLVSVAGSAIP